MQRIVAFVSSFILSSVSPVPSQWAAIKPGFSSNKRLNSSYVSTSVVFSDLKVEEGVELLQDADMVVATVGIVKEEEVAAPVLEGEEPAEPEVIGKGKKEDEEAE